MTIKKQTFEKINDLKCDWNDILTKLCQIMPKFFCDISCT